MDFQAPPPAGGFGGGRGSSFGPPSFGHVSPLSYDRGARTAMLLGIFAIPFNLMCMLGMPLGVVAVCIALEAQKKMKSEPHLHHGGGMARAGFWCGVVSIALAGVHLAIFGVQMILAFFS